MCVLPGNTKLIKAHWTPEKQWKAERDGLNASQPSVPTMASRLLTPASLAVGGDVEETCTVE